MNMCNYECGLDEDDRKYIVENLNETDETRRAALQEIKKWLRDEKKTLRARSEDKYIVPFLRVSKFNLDETKTRLTNYYTMKRDRPEWFHNRNPSLPEIQELVKLGVFVPLKRTSGNKLVVIIRTAVHNPRKHSIDDVFKAGKMMLEVAAMKNKKAQIYGVTVILDMAGAGFSHAVQLTPSTIKNTVHAWQNYHCQPKQLEFINAPLHVNAILTIFKSFMSEKLRERVRVHFKGLEKLYQTVDRSILPPEYGGSGEELASLISYWNEELLRHESWFAEDECYKAE